MCLFLCNFIPYVDSSNHCNSQDPELLITTKERSCATPLHSQSSTSSYSLATTNLVSILLTVSHIQMESQYCNHLRLQPGLLQSMGLQKVKTQISD